MSAREQNTLDLTVSLDGLISRPNSEGSGLHGWYFAEVGAAKDIKRELLDRIGAIILGHTAFGTAPDGFDTEYKVPRFILTHTPLPTAERGGATFIFVTDGIESALNQARAAAGGKDICAPPATQTTQAFLKTGLLDELQLHLAPVPLGGSLRLFGDLDTVTRCEN